jgi:hypothetical protein
VTTSMTKASVSKVFNMGIRHPEVFHTLVAMGQMVMDSLRGMEKPSKQVLSHKGRAMSLLNQKMSEPGHAINETTMFAVLNLMTLDFSEFDLESYQIHLNALRGMLVLSPSSANGILQKIFDGYIEISLVLIRAMAYLRNQMISFTSMCLIEGDLVDQNRDQVLPAGFQALLEEGEISLKLAKVIRRMSIWMAEANDTRVNLAVGASRGYPPWFDAKSLFACLEEAKVSSTEELVSLALFCLAIDIIWRFRSSVVLFSMIDKLLTIVCQYHHRTPSRNAAWRWAVIVAAGSALDETPLGFKGNAVIDFALAQDAIDLPAMVNTVRDFFYLRHRLKHWQSCWTAGLERRTRASTEQQMGLPQVLVSTRLRNTGATTQKCPQAKSLNSRQ